MGVRATRLRRLRIRKAIGHSALGVGLLAAGVLYLALEKNVTLVVDGRPAAVRTLTGNVGQLLTAQGITLDTGDVVEPPVTTSLADGMTVVVQTAGLATAAEEGSAGVGVWVVDGVSGPFDKLAVQPTESLVSADGLVGPSRIVGARVVVMGKEHDVLTNATTVRELLSAMGIKPDGLDRVQPPPRTPLQYGGEVRYVDVELRTHRIESTIPFQTINSYTRSLDPGEVKIVQRGDPGLQVRTYRVKVVDGKVMSRKLVSTHVIAGAVPARRLVGRSEPASSANGSQVGEACWYEAAGSGLTAAHPTLPFGTIVKVTNLANGRSVTVVINDRGPFGGRIIDLSQEAFARIAPLGQGVANVRLTW